MPVPPQALPAPPPRLWAPRFAWYPAPRVCPGRWLPAARRACVSPRGTACAPAFPGPPDGWPRSRPVCGGRPSRHPHHRLRPDAAPSRPARADGRPGPLPLGVPAPRAPRQAQSQAHRGPSHPMSEKTRACPLAEYLWCNAGEGSPRAVLRSYPSRGRWAFGGRRRNLTRTFAARSCPRSGRSPRSDVPIAARPAPAGVRRPTAAARQRAAGQDKARPRRQNRFELRDEAALRNSPEL